MIAGRPATHRILAHRSLNRQSPAHHGVIGIVVVLPRVGIKVALLEPETILGEVPS